VGGQAAAAAAGAAGQPRPGDAARASSAERRRRTPTKVIPADAEEDAAWRRVEGRRATWAAHMAQSTCSTPDAVAVAAAAATASAASSGNVAGPTPPPPKTGAMEPYDVTGATTTATATDLPEIAARAGMSEDGDVAPAAGSASASPAPSTPPKDKQDGDALAASDGADGIADADGDAAAAAASAALGGPPDEAGADETKLRWRADVDWTACGAKVSDLALRAKLWPEPGARRLPVPAMIVLGAFVGAIGSLIAIAFEEILHGLVHLIWDIVFTRYREVLRRESTLALPSLRPLIPLAHVLRYVRARPPTQSIPASVPGWTFIVFTTPIILAFFAAATAVIPTSWVGVMPDLLRHIHSDDPHMPWQWAASMFVMSMVRARPVPLTATAQAHASPLTSVRVHSTAAYEPAPDHAHRRRAAGARAAGPGHLSHGRPLDGRMAVVHGARPPRPYHGHDYRRA